MIRAKNTARLQKNVCCFVSLAVGMCICKGMRVRGEEVDVIIFLGHQLLGELPAETINVNVCGEKVQSCYRQHRLRGSA